MLHQSLGKMSHARSPAMSTLVTKKTSEQETTVTASRHSRHLRHKSGGASSLHDSLAKAEVKPFSANYVSVETKKINQVHE